MFNGFIEIAVLTAIALFVLSRLYVALGKDDGAETRRRDPANFERKKPVSDGPSPAASQRAEPHIADIPTFAGPAAVGLEAIYNRDRAFNPDVFLRGAKQAYSMIVEAFADGDRKTLRPLLDDDVYEAWDEAIDNRANTGADAFRLLRLRNAEIHDAEMDGDTARVMMRYEAELGDGETVRRAKEIWTFMRDVTSRDPNWILDDVEAAN